MGQGPQGKEGDASTNQHRRAVLIGLALLALAAALVALNWPRTDALTAALNPLIEKQSGEQSAELSAAARAILDNYVETRANAARWSGLYWGFTFCAAAFSALAGLLLKFETILKSNELKKDVATTLSVVSALLITVSTSGDFQRKWQANRAAASELERAGYALIEGNLQKPQQYFSTIGDILYRRNLAIIGSLDKAPTETASAEEKAATQEPVPAPEQTAP